jgi:hypothetical protein
MRKAEWLYLNAISATCQSRKYKVGIISVVQYANKQNKKTTLFMPHAQHVYYIIYLNHGHFKFAILKLFGNIFA